MEKERIATIALHYTYEVPIKCTDETLKLIEEYPKTRGELPLEILKKIEEAPDHCDCCSDWYAEVVETDTVEFWGDSK